MYRRVSQGFSLGKNRQGLGAYLVQLRRRRRPPELPHASQGIQLPRPAHCQHHEYKTLGTGKDMIANMKKDLATLHEWLAFAPFAPGDHGQTVSSPQSASPAAEAGFRPYSEAAEEDAHLYRNDGGGDTRSSDGSRGPPEAKADRWGPSCSRNRRDTAGHSRSTARCSTAHHKRPRKNRGHDGSNRSDGHRNGRNSGDCGPGPVSPPPTPPAPQHQVSVCETYS